MMDEQQIAAMAAQTAIDNIVNGLMRRLVQLETEAAVLRYRLEQAQQQAETGSRND
jgi:hypothetical protein